MMISKSKSNSLLRLIKACRNTRDGLLAVYKMEAAFRQELWAIIILIPLAFILSTEPFSRALMIASLILVLIIEVLNSAIEAIVDRIGSEIHPLSKVAKDAGSAAVFLAILNAVIIWILCC